MSACQYLTSIIANIFYCDLFGFSCGRLVDKKDNRRSEKIGGCEVFLDVLV